MTKKILIGLLLAVMACGVVFAISPEEIMRKVDELQTFETSIASGEMKITDRFGEKISTFNSWSRGTDDTLIEFTSVAEKGQKILRTADSLYLYYPDAEELIRMQGSALRQSMLGSDISYEDMTGNKDRISQYSVALTGEESINGRLCYVLELVANTRTVPYPKEKVWVDKETFLGWKAEYSTKSGRLLKTMEVLETQMLKGRPIATVSRISDKLKKDTQTIMIMHSIEVDVPIDPKIFSLDELSW